MRYGAGVGLTAGAAAYLFAPWTLVAALGALLYVAGAAALPRLALQLVVVSTPFYLLDKQAGSLPFSPTEFLLLGAGAAWLLRAGWRAAQHGWRPRLSTATRPDWPVLLFAVGAVAASLAAPDLGTHLRQLRVVVAEPMLFYLLARDEANDEDGFFGLLDALAVAGAAIGVYAIYQYLFTTDTIVAEGVGRARGLYGSPNNLGLFLGRVLPISVCLAFWGGDRRRFHLLALVPVAVALALTFSVGAWLGTGAALLFVAFASGSRRLAAVVAGGLVLVFLGGFAFGLERITSHFSVEGSTWRWRAYVWQAGWDMARDHPVLGIGLDNFLGLYERYMAEDAWPEPNLSHPHNLVLDFWLSTGIVGLTGALWLLGRAWWRALAMWRRAQGQLPLAAAGLGLAASIVDTVAHGAFDNSYFLVDLALVFWLSQALVNAQREPRGSAIVRATTVTTREGKEGARDRQRSSPQLP
ncbi:MAG: O-antigen ligase family protein [Chloroflexota bacterium]